MFFKKKKPFVRFVNAMPGVEIAHPVIKANEYKFDWFRSAAVDYKQRQQNPKPTDFLISTSRCPGLQHFFKTGFIITNPIDFTITTDSNRPGMFKWECPVNAVFEGRDYIGAHTPDQLADFMPFREDTLSTLIKLHTRWRMNSSPDIVFLQLPIAYPDHNVFTAAHGIIDNQVLLEVNVQLFWHKLNGTQLVKAGTPLCHMVPFPRNFLVDLKVETMTREDKYVEMAYEYLAKKEYNKDFKSFFDSCKKLLTRKEDN